MLICRYVNIGNWGRRRMIFNVTGWLGALLLFCVMAVLVTLVLLIVYLKAKNKKQARINYFAYFLYWTSAIIAFGIFQWYISLFVWLGALIVETVWLCAKVKQTNLDNEEFAQKNLRGRKREQARKGERLKVNMLHCILAQLSTLLCLSLPLLCEVVGIPQVTVQTISHIGQWLYGFLCISGFVCAVYASGLRGRFSAGAADSPFMPAEDVGDKVFKCIDLILFFLIFIFFQGLWMAICFWVK